VNAARLHQCAFAQRRWRFTRGQTPANPRFLASRRRLLDHELARIRVLPMIGLIIRLLVLCSVVFAVVYAITRALRANATSKEAQRIQEEIRSLRATVELGVVDPEEYAVLADRIKRDCERLGIQVPDLPLRLPRPRKDD
jgi:hypothetical protein